MKFRKKIMISYIVLISISVIVLSVIYYFTSKDTVLDIARKNVLEIVSLNNVIMDEKLSKVEESTLHMIADCDLFQIFNDNDFNDDYQLLLADRKITQIMNNYLSVYPDIDSAQMYTSYYRFGQNANSGLPVHSMDSQLIRLANEGEGKLQWAPVRESQNGPLFAAVRKINLSCVSNGVIRKLPPEKERPILVLFFNKNTYRAIFEHSIPIEESSFLIVDPQGSIISHSDNDQLKNNKVGPWYGEIGADTSGTRYIDIQGSKKIVVFDRSQITGWTSVILIPNASLMNNILSTMKVSMFNLTLILCLLSFLFAYLFSAKITNPLNQLLRAISKVSHGNFNVKITDQRDDEFGHLINKFNDMNDRIKQLIEENYLVKIREKETEIMVLNIQLNPHFLHNTINTMHWLSLHGEKEKLSHMLISLSKMLHYTIDLREETTMLKQDLEWLDQYISIMNNRFEHKFEVHFHINPILMNYKVPKLIFQPFVENAIKHGFANMGHGGKIEIYGWLQESTVFFSVEDNGCGMTPDQISGIRHDNRHSFGINNVDKRIKLLYGDEFGVQIHSEPQRGTTILLTIPWTPDSSLISK